MQNEDAVKIARALLDETIAHSRELLGTTNPEPPAANPTPDGNETQGQVEEVPVDCEHNWKPGKLPGDKSILFCDKCGVTNFDPNGKEAPQDAT